MPTAEVTGLPLLAAQEGIWTGQLLDLGSPAYNTAEYVLIEGEVDTKAFDAALHHVVAETEALHFRFVQDDRGRPRQVPCPVPDWSLYTADLGTEDDPLTSARAWMAADMDRAADLGREPLFRHALLRLGAGRTLWYHRVHHIALDGYGLSLVARRVAEVYTALCEGGEPGAAGFGSLDSVLAEERAYRESARCARDREHWTGRYADRPPVATPAGRAALPARTFHRQVADLPPASAEALRQAAARLDATWSEVLLAVTAAHLHRETGAPEIVLSVPVTGRLGSVALRVPTMVRNILPLRVRVGPGDSLGDLAPRISAELRASLPHQRFRYEQLRRDLGLVGGGRRLSGPGVNIMPFAYDLRFAGLRSTVHNLSAGPVDDLAFNVYDRAEGAGLRFAVDGNPELYPAGEVARHQRELFALLDAMTGAPEEPLATLSGQPRGGAPVVLDGGPLPTPARPVLDLFGERVAAHPDRPAVEHGGECLSYAEVHEAARRIARRLAARGIGRGDTVAVALPRGTGAVTALLGVLMSGAAYCPLDPSAPAERLSDLLGTARPELLLSVGAHAPATEHVPLLLLDEPDRTQASSPAPSAADPDDLAYVLHTSGSTGRPKGVEIGHRALAHFVAAAGHRYGPREGERVLQFAPLHFDASIEEIFLALCQGSTLVVRPDDMTDSVPGFLRACADLRLGFLGLPTAYWHELAHALSHGAGPLPAPVHTVVIGGEAALPDRVTRWRQTVGTGVRLLNTYGPTEGTVVATVADLHDPALPDLDVPVGLPLPGLRAAVVDGELHLLGPQLATGYRGASEEDRARFAPLHRLPGAPRAYRTGDLAEVGADGQLRHLGRADEEFKISGHRVQPAEVENALLSHPGIRDAAVVGRTAQDGTRHLAAFLVAADEAPPSEDVRAHLRDRLPTAMVPAALTFLPAIPRTSAGKTDRNHLVGLRESATPGPETPEPESENLERTLVRIWQTSLGGAEVGGTDDVFVLGAHSLQAIQAANRMSTALGREVKVGWLFQHPTPAGLARFLLHKQEPLRDGPTPAPTALSADAVLDPRLRPVSGTTPPSPPCRILLTGATGFVGAHLLERLLHATRAEIVCLVRAPETRTAAGRLREALAVQGITLPQAHRGRVTPVPADLALPRFGLSEAAFASLAQSADMIVHNGAAVSILRDYASLRAANTESTRQLLALAAERRVPLHFVSTLSVAPPRSAAAEVPERFLPPHPWLNSGYQQSKWASEHLLEQAAARGFPVTVHRLGRVLGAVSTGYVNPQDFLWSVLRAGIPTGSVPELFDEEVWTPVDTTAAAVVHLALHHDGGSAVFHHAPAPPVRLAEVHDWLREYGYRIRTLPLPEWCALLPADSPGNTALLTFLSRGQGAGAPLGLGTVRTGNTETALAGSGLTAAPFDRAVFFRYLDHCVRTGALPPPAGGRGPTAA
ncbi:amino acid adenylation domain-containing protein [Streptomyces physcomitrii]|uniref:amino acid adenylation domain-containing protein n=1 Tax=Streptomyces physcomitrii TaxID=2724184 RepID=UPI0033DE94BB